MERQNTKSADYIEQNTSQNLTFSTVGQIRSLQKESSISDQISKYKHYFNRKILNNL